MSTEIKTQKNLSRTQKSKNLKNQKTVLTKKVNRSLIPTSISDVLEPLRAKHSILHAKSNVDGFELLGSESKSDSKEQERAFVNSLGMLKGILFKRDQPYRTLLPLQGLFATNGSGVVSLLISNTSLASTAEWTSITALFDEFYVHGIKFRYVPVNDAGAGLGQCGSAGVVGPMTAIADTSYSNCGLLCCSLFNAAPTYNTASAMAANSTLGLRHTGKAFKYKWLNNVRFDRHGICLPTLSGGGWQGWMDVGGVASYGGNIQFRTLNDQVVGSGSAIVNMGQYLVQFDVSFRARS